jgi:ribonuclease D
MQDYILITQTGPLANWCAKAAEADFVAVDFEFMRENNYYSQLCLVQVATTQSAAVIDPLASGIDLAPFWALLNDAEVLKVFHAGGQDIEIVVNKTGRVPHPMFDTQIAGMAMGLGEQVSYQNLIGTLLGQQIDKGARFTDWSRRPLDQRQLDYAVGDVTFLVQAFPKMLEFLKEKGRGAWLDDEMSRLSELDNYSTKPEDAWERLKLPGRDLKVLGRLRALAAWREREAIDKDIPRGRIAKDETLMDIAAHPPKEQVELAKVRGLSDRWINNEIGARLYEAVSTAPPLPRELLPNRDDGVNLNRQARQVAELLKLLLKLSCEDEDIAPKLVCRGSDLEQLAGGVRDLPVLNGWRYELFGRQALDLIEGRLSLRVKAGKLQVTDEPKM